MFQSLVGSLLYAALGTRPDINYAVSNVAKYSALPTQAHWNTAKRILRYLKRTKNLVLWYYQTDEQVIGYSGANFARNVDGCHSVSGCAFISGSGAISWYSGKQKCVSTSTTQAEYIALSHATKAWFPYNRLCLKDRLYRLIAA